MPWRLTEGWSIGTVEADLQRIFGDLTAGRDMTDRSGGMWSRLPVWVKVLGAGFTIWISGWTTAVAVQKYMGTPDILADHEARITALELARDVAVQRNNRNFIYVACRLDELAAGAASDARCDLVLDEETRELLKQLRAP